MQVAETKPFARCSLAERSEGKHVLPEHAYNPPMVKPYRPGVEARAAILGELRRREDAGLTVTVRALAEALRMKRSTLADHLATMRRAGLVVANPGRNGGHKLTDAGKIATDGGLTKPD